MWVLQRDLYDGAEYLEGLHWLVLLLSYSFLLLQLSWVWKGAAQDLEMHSSVQRHSLQNLRIPEVVINFFNQKKGMEKGMYTALHTLLNPVLATTQLQAAQMRTVFWYKQITAHL